MDKAFIVDAFKKEFEAIRNITPNTHNMETRYVRLSVFDRISEMYPAPDQEAAKDAIAFHGGEIRNRIIKQFEKAFHDVDVKLTIIETVDKPDQALYLIQGYPVGLLHCFSYEGPKDSDGRPTIRVSFVFDPNGKTFK